MPKSESESKETSIPPPVFWAQRKDIVYLLINVPDCEEGSIMLNKDSLLFKGRGGSDNKNYEIQLDFFKEIDPQASRNAKRGRGIEFVLIKAEKGPFWQRLLSKNEKHHWLKVDFNKWKDEDDSDIEAGDGTDFEEMMKQMGGLNTSSNDLNDLDDDDEIDSMDEVPT